MKCSTSLSSNKNVTTASNEVPHNIEKSDKFHNIPEELIILDVIVLRKRILDETSKNIFKGSSANYKLY